ncbi:MAG: FtsX-like permease family protein [Streptosporangiaceae bacterium]
MFKATLAGLFAHKMRVLLTSLAIVLGVGFIAGTFVLTDSMKAGFDQQFAQSAAKVDVAVLPADGERLAPATLQKVRQVAGVTSAQGLVRGDAALLGKDGKAVGDEPTVGFSVATGPLERVKFLSGRAPSGPGEAVLAEQTAKKAGFGVGDTVQVLSEAGKRYSFQVSGLIDGGLDQDIGFRGGVGFTAPAAAVITGEKGFTEIDVAGAASVAAVRQVADGHEVLTGDQLASKLSKASGADIVIITTGLLIFGMISLLVAALVIYNTFTILMAQRMREHALLRCIGAGKRQILTGVLTESAIVGLVGSLFGLVVGAGLGAGGLGLISSLGASVPTTFTLAPRTVILSLLVGIAMTVLSALLPARAATRVSPMAALRTDQEPGTARFRLGLFRWISAVVLGGLGVALTAVALAAGAGEVPMYLVAGGAVLVFAAVVALMPLLIRPLSRLFGWLPARVGGVPGRLAVQNSWRSPKRTATTTIALTIGVGLMSLFAVIGASSKQTGNEMIVKQFPVDYVLQTQSRGDLPAGLEAALRAQPAFGAVSSRTPKDLEMGPSGDNTLFVDLRPGTSAAAGAQAIAEATASYPTVKVTDAATVKEQFTTAIDRMLLMFGCLLGFAVLISLFGIANTLTLSVVERTRESALLRALGITKRQLRRMLSLEAVVMALIGASVGVVLGVVFGWASIRAISAEIVFSLPYAQIAGFIVLAAVAGVVAAVLPARRAARASIVGSITG